MEETLYDGQGRPIAYISDAMRCLFIFGRAMPWHTLLKKIFTAGTASTPVGLLTGYFTTDGGSARDQSVPNAPALCMLRQLAPIREVKRKVSGGTRKADTTSDSRADGQSNSSRTSRREDKGYLFKAEKERGVASLFTQRAPMTHQA